MAKRFTDTDIWKNQRWFRKLPPTYKLVFCYIKDQCSHAGIWKIDCSDLIDDLGISEFNLIKFIDAVNIEFDKITGKKSNKERLRIINKTFLWITGFIQFQYEGKDGIVNVDAAPVRTALMSLEGFGTLTEGLDKGYIRLNKDLPEGCITPKDKDKDKDKEFLKKGGKGGNRNGHSYINKKIVGVKFDKKKKKVLLTNNSWQELGISQLSLVEIGELKPESIYLGGIH